MYQTETSSCDQRLRKCHNVSCNLQWSKQTWLVLGNTRKLCHLVFTDVDGPFTLGIIWSVIVLRENEMVTSLNLKVSHNKMEKSQKAFKISQVVSGTLNLTYIMFIIALLSYFFSIIVILMGTADLWVLQAYGYCRLMGNTHKRRLMGNADLWVIHTCVVSCAENLILM